VWLGSWLLFLTAQNMIFFVKSNPLKFDRYAE
jgi:hypothetical protein